MLNTVIRVTRLSMLHKRPMLNVTLTCVPVLLLILSHHSSMGHCYGLVLFTGKVVQCTVPPIQVMLVKNGLPAITLRRRIHVLTTTAPGVVVAVVLNIVTLIFIINDVLTLFCTDKNHAWWQVTGSHHLSNPRHFILRTFKLLYYWMY